MTGEDDIGDVGVIGEDGIDGVDKGDRLGMLEGKNMSSMK